MMRERQAVADAPGKLRAKLTDDEHRELASVEVTAEYAERAAFARTALAVKLRELDARAAIRDQLIDEVHRLVRECRDLAVQCERDDADLRGAINGITRKAQR